MYALNLRCVIGEDKKPVEVLEKHLVATFTPTVRIDLSSEEDSFGNRSTSADGVVNFIVKALCGEEFTTEEISMFGDAGLCEECAKAFKELPRYIR